MRRHLRLNHKLEQSYIQILLIYDPEGNTLNFSQLCEITINKNPAYPVESKDKKMPVSIQIRQVNKEFTLLFIARTLFLFHHLQAKIFIYTLNKNFIFLPLVICKGLSSLTFTQICNITYLNKVD
ncbi:hypothetical protein CN558_12590 [Bacillus wiedmannii]|uniref:Uncharacterized protein n=1 Tax=Bacillus wiedmannii TaxID=1890302 RepID=A0A2C5G5Y6_9BACI|nr:hypothetical protein CN690_16910 [Bacillus wiedmannii]PEL75911.1 hypothetical protein CN609_26840 [Bacillus wiedmannii]PEM34497.1 hypothetical protein CN598_00155 [Bacillus wiedmannii]PEM81514.1 hypothetical protein CN627_28320 [Bacillus wiedmannii]PEO86080.1 hypothetical protein CN558_12590 [Bacillus wiedmannii]